MVYKIALIVFLACASMLMLSAGGLFSLSADGAKSLNLVGGIAGVVAVFALIFE